MYILWYLRPQQPCAEIPYYVQIHFQMLLEAGFPSPEPNPRRTSLEEEGGGNPETRGLRGVKETNTTFLSTQGFWFEVSRCQRHCRDAMGRFTAPVWEHVEIRSTMTSLFFIIFFNIFFLILHINQYLPVILCFCFCFLADFYQ